MENEPGKDDKWEFYQIDNGDWWWRRICPRNGEMTGGSTEGYRNRAMCIKNAMRPAYEPGVSVVEFLPRKKKK